MKGPGSTSRSGGAESPFPLGAHQKEVRSSARGKKNLSLLCKCPLIGKKRNPCLRKAYPSSGEAPRALRRGGAGLEAAGGRTEQVLLPLRSQRGSGSAKNRQLTHALPFAGVLEAPRSN